MINARYLLAALTTVIVLQPAHCLLAQGSYPYRPSRPTMSPYFNYFRNNTGGLPQYYQFVNPEIQRRSFYQNQTNLNRYQSGVNQYQFSRVGGLQQQFQSSMTPSPYASTQPGTGLTTNSQFGIGIGIPSAAASFMNYSHYYPQTSVSPQIGASQRSYGNVGGGGGGSISGATSLGIGGTGGIGRGIR